MNINDRVKELYASGMNTYDIICSILEEYDVSVQGASILVDSIIEEEL